MIRITNTEGLTLELEPGTVVTVERNNPLFNDQDKLVQDVSWEFDVPMTENNQLFFGMAHLPETPNTVYVQAVRFDITGVEAWSGNVRCEYSNGRYRANLQPNFAALAERIKGIRLPEIRTEDGYFDFPTPESFADFMLATATNPGAYPLVFFPVYNPNWHGPNTDFNIHDDFVNRFVDNKFKAFDDGASFPNYTPANIPFWKLTHILKQVAAYLGLTPVGDVFTDAELDKIYINTRISIPNVYYGPQRYIAPSMAYMPNILVGDFLKKVRDRYHVAIDFDLLAGEMTFETYKTISRKEAIDLTPFVSKIEELKQPVKKGFKVTLKSDEADEAMKAVDLNGEEGFPPLFTLTAGNGEEEIEIDCGTVNKITTDFTYFPVIKQSVYNRIAYLSTAGVPPDMAYQDPKDPTTLNNFPLRLIRYDGLQDIGSGTLWPFAGPVELDNDDVEWFRFLNDAKPLVITASVPAVVLTSLKPTNRYTVKTEGGNYISFVYEKMPFDVKQQGDLIPVKLYARMLNAEIDTRVVIEPLNTSIDDESGNITVLEWAAVVKACFDPIVHGISEMRFQIFNVFDGAPVSEILTIKIPTNNKGAGGVAVSVPLPLFEGYIFEPQLRVYNGNPKYLLRGGRRVNFTAGSGYAYVNLYAETFMLMADITTVFY